MVLRLPTGVIFDASVAARKRLLEKVIRISVMKGRLSQVGLQCVSNFTKGQGKQHVIYGF
jgi:hypothetical protein